MNTTTPATSAARRAGLSAVAVGMIAAPVILMPTMASALPSEDLGCGTTTPAATLVAPGVCEVLITESGTFTAPSGLSKLAAFMVGAGGAGWGADGIVASYGGGAGEVVYVDSVEFASPLAITIGTGGSADVDVLESGGSTIMGDYTALGGSVSDGMTGGVSGNGYLGTQTAPDCTIDTAWEYSGGGGGATSIGVDNNGGAGLVLSEFPDVDATLFPPLETATLYGVGGDSCSLAPVPGNTGNGGTASLDSAQNGSHGVVIFRYAAVAVPAAAPTVPVLAATGPSSDSVVAAGAASALFAAGAALLLMVRRSRKNA